MDPEECTICIEPLNEQGKQITQLTCRHSFHTKCFASYVASRHPQVQLENVEVDCPLCRAHVVITIQPEKQCCNLSKSIAIAALLPSAAISFMLIYFFVLSPKLPN